MRKVKTTTLKSPATYLNRDVENPTIQ